MSANCSALGTTPSSGLQAGASQNLLLSPGNRRPSAAKTSDFGSNPAAMIDLSSGASAGIYPLSDSGAGQLGTIYAALASIINDPAASDAAKLSAYAAWSESEAATGWQAHGFQTTKAAQQFIQDTANSSFMREVGQRRGQVIHRGINRTGIAGWCKTGRLRLTRKDEPHQT